MGPYALPGNPYCSCAVNSCLGAAHWCRIIALDAHHPLWYQWNDLGGRERGDPEPTPAQRAE